MENVKTNIKNLIEENEGASSFAKIVPSIVKKGIDEVNLNMFDDHTREGLLNASGDEFVKRGDFVQAVKSFLLTKNVNKLNEIGDIFSSRGQFNQAIEIYNLGYNFSQDRNKLIKCGEKCLVEAHLSDALRAFSILKDEPRLVKLGEVCLEKDKLDVAIEVFAILKNNDKLIRLGDKCMNENKLSYAARAYELAGEKDKLSNLGDVLLKSGLIGTALRIYELANNQMMVQFIKENFSEDQFSKFYA
jgi:tetratricopeptide (TPR) repeat protein